MSSIYQPGKCAMVIGKAYRSMVGNSMKGNKLRKKRFHGFRAEKKGKNKGITHDD